MNSSDSNLMVVLKQNSSFSLSIVLGNPCGILLNSLRCFIPQNMSSSKSKLTSTSILPFCHADVSSRSIFPFTCILWPVAVNRCGMFVWCNSRFYLSAILFFRTKESELSWPGRAQPILA